MAMSSGINFHGFGNFIIPLSKEFGWSRTTVSAVFSLARLEAGFIGPVTKALPLEYAVELNKLIELEMEGSIG